jgi:hypothetical protein
MSARLGKFRLQRLDPGRKRRDLSRLRIDQLRLALGRNLFPAGLKRKRGR